MQCVIPPLWPFALSVHCNSASCTVVESKTGKQAEKTHSIIFKNAVYTFVLYNLAVLNHLSSNFYIQWFLKTCLFKETVKKLLFLNYSVNTSTSTSNSQTKEKLCVE